MSKAVTAAPLAGKENHMFTKLTHLQAEALDVFYDFVRAIRTQRWVSGVELGPKDYDKKPSDSSRREVTVWQGSKNSLYQKLVVKFVYSGDHGWFIQAIVFEVKSGNGESSQAFRIATDYEDVRRFIPCKLDHRWYITDYTDAERRELHKQWFAR